MGSVLVSFKVYKKSTMGIVRQELVTYRYNADGMLIIETQTRRYMRDSYHDCHSSSPVAKIFDETVAVTKNV
jgi:hypothetical protein